MLVKQNLNGKLAKVFFDLSRTEREFKAVKGYNLETSARKSGRCKLSSNYQNFPQQSMQKGYKKAQKMNLASVLIVIRFSRILFANDF